MDLIRQYYLTGIDFEQLNDYCLLEVVKYLSPHEAVRFERLNKRFKKLADRHHLMINSVPNESGLTFGFAYPFPYHRYVLKLPKLKHVRMMNKIQVDPGFGLKLAECCPKIERFTRLTGPSDFETVLNYVHRLSKVNMVQDIEVECMYATPATILFMFLSELADHCPRLRKVSIINKLITEYMTADFLSVIQSLATKLSAVNFDVNEDLFNIVYPSLGGQLEELKYCGSLVRAAVNPFSLCNQIANSFRNLVKLSIKAPIATIRHLKVLSKLRNLQFFDDTDATVTRLVPLNEMRTNHVLNSAPDAIRDYLQSSRQLLILDIQLSVFNLERVEEIVEYISEDGQNLMDFAINIRHDVMAGGEVAPALAAMSSLRELKINEAILRPWNLDIVLKKCYKLRKIGFRELDVDSKENESILISYASRHPKRKFEAVIAKAAFAYRMEDNGKQFSRDTVRLGKSRVIENLVLTRLREM